MNTQLLGPKEFYRWINTLSQSPKLCVRRRGLGNTGWRLVYEIAEACRRLELPAPKTHPTTGDPIVGMGPPRLVEKDGVAAMSIDFWTEHGDSAEAFVALDPRIELGLNDWFQPLPATRAFLGSFAPGDS